MLDHKQENITRVIGVIASLLLVLLALQEYFSFENAILGKFSFTWIVYLFIILLLSGFLIFFVFMAFKSSGWKKQLIAQLLSFRKNLGWGKWLIIFISIFSGVWFFQYTPWGAVFTTPFLRLMIFISLTCWVSFLLCSDEQQWVNYQHVAVALIITGSLWIAVLNLKTVTDFPFALSWSEGNRIWDYSIPFGRRLYDYPAGKPIFVYTDLARRWIFGIPFLLPHPTIEVVRLWIALVSFVPYALLGWLVLKPQKGKVLASFLGGLWLSAFLYQGGVYAPLMIAAILVVIACWYSPWWLGLFLQFAASYLLLVARIQWVIAPVFWLIMLIFLINDDKVGQLSHKEQDFDKWQIIKVFLYILTFSLPLVYIRVPFIYSRLIEVNMDFAKIITEITHQIYFYIFLFLLSVLLCLIAFYYRKAILTLWNYVYIKVTVILMVLLSIIAIVFFFFNRIFPELLAGQSLLWYRLLPNPTNPLGILLMLILAVLPLALLLLITYRKKIWTLPPSSGWLIIFSLGIFFVIGLIVSVKIGGGNNLHNMDLFMITWVLAAGIAWRNGLGNYLANVKAASIAVKVLFLVMLLLPFIRPLQELRPLDLPSVDYTLNALNQLRIEVEDARPKGEILFIDQRQLLTFGYIRVPLVVEYEKKLLQDRALSANQSYFQPFYDDLAQHRFSLIISSPLKIDYKQINESGEIFGEENSAWTRWVAEPLLQYYKPRWTFKKIGVQVLVPIDKAH